jgi:dolichol kinase
MPLSLVFMSLIWLPKDFTFFIFGMLVLTISDAVAALVGKLWAKKKILSSEKTYLGSFAFLISTIILLLVIIGFNNLNLIILISIILTLLEFILIYGIDNIFLPIVASYLLYFIF